MKEHTKEDKLHSSIFTNPIDDIKKEFANKYHAKVCDALEKSNEILKILQEARKSLEKRDRVIKRLDLTNQAVNIIENTNYTLYQSDFKSKCNINAKLRLNLILDYCHIFEETIHPFREELNTILLCIKKFIQKIKTTTHATDDSNTQKMDEKFLAQIRKIGSDLQNEYDKINQDHQHLLTLIRSTAELLIFQDKTVKEGIANYLVKNDPDIYEWKTCWFKHINNLEYPEDVFQSALDAMNEIYEPREVSHQQTTTTVSCNS